LLASSWRLLALSFSGSTVVFVGIMVGFCVLIGLTAPFLGRRLDFLLWTLIFAARIVSFMYSGDTHEFLTPRPFRTGPRVVAGVVFPLLAVLILPAAGLCFTNQGWLESGGLIGRLIGKPRPPSEDEIRYMREILGATFLPAKWPAAGLPADLWAQLRPLMFVDVLRTALLVVMMLFGLAPLPKAGEKSNAGSALAATLLGLAVVLAVFFRVDFVEKFAGWPVPRVWFLALLAAASVAQWSWRARRLNAPARASAAATGISA
jgi:hypothetical protein